METSYVDASLPIDLVGTTSWPGFAADADEDFEVTPDTSALLSAIATIDDPEGPLLDALSRLTAEKEANARLARQVDVMRALGGLSNSGLPAQAAIHMQAAMRRALVRTRNVCKLAAHASDPRAVAAIALLQAAARKCKAYRAAQTVHRVTSAACIQRYTRKYLRHLQPTTKSSLRRDVLRLRVALVAQEASHQAEAHQMVKEASPPAVLQVWPGEQAALEAQEASHQATLEYLRARHEAAVAKKEAAIERLIEQQVGSHRAQRQNAERDRQAWVDALKAAHSEEIEEASRRAAREERARCEREREAIVAARERAEATVAAAQAARAEAEAMVVEARAESTRLADLNADLHARNDELHSKLDGLQSAALNVPVGLPAPAPAETPAVEKLALEEDLAYLAAQLVTITEKADSLGVENVDLASQLEELRRKADQLAEEKSDLAIALEEAQDTASRLLVENMGLAEAK
mmetsp:Transcript_86790/g.173250  ORF Transcript_86790/g.173250 Transcript_86790/m.173250 type:complete len:465 (-) Transcript_86790:246-1640(-)|eukprot:CAMPEP_0174718704 /NCGR_PEP_ID=MMETSP1094-20130205/29755_1 /TAXON_ID=156173 /ORGANISM="Chrysochromulina brevifilum, Strain UTEX LB 985" /LENGTH=464 /DNA_ID=CAMNT_0015918873 /DNA_START=68 /DNA_END=1462 /DNA_ORIENTATION=+